MMLEDALKSLVAMSTAVMLGVCGGVVLAGQGFDADAAKPLPVERPSVRAVLDTHDRRIDAVVRKLELLKLDVGDDRADLANLHRYIDACLSEVLFVKPIDVPLVGGIVYVQASETDPDRILLISPQGDCA